MGSTRLTVDTPCQGWQDEVSLDRLGELLSDRQNVLWLDIRDPGPPEIELLGRTFGFHELALEDVGKLQLHQRPRCDTYGGYYFIVLYAAEPTVSEVTLSELQVFWGENYLVTLHQGDLAMLDQARRRWQAHDRRQDHGVGYVAYTVCDSLVDGYFPVQNWFGERVDEIEEAVLKGAVGAAGDLYQLRKQLMNIRRMVAPTGDVVAEVIRREQSRIPESLQPYLADVQDHLLHVLGELDSYRDLLAAALDVHSESMFGRLALVVQRLTAITVIIMVPNLVASIYGMNFENFFPPHDWEYGFLVVVAVILVMILWGFIHSRLLSWL